MKLEPRAKVEFRVKFKSRISDQVSAKLIFTNKKEANIQANALVFLLISDVYEKRSIEEHYTKARLY